jgi:plasmid stabilization system protein ParE
MRLRYTRLALADLDTILDYIEERSPTGATRVWARIRRDQRSRDPAGHGDALSICNLL